MNKNFSPKRVAKNETFHTLVNSHDHCINAATREVFLHGWLGCSDDEPGVDWRMASVLIKNIRFLNNQSNDNILIHQNTLGGEWADGMAIYDAILTSEARTTMLCYGHSRSMSSITLQAADVRVLTPNCYFMVHDGSMFVEDTVLGVLSAAEQAKRDMETMLDVYTSRCTIKRSEIKRRIRAKQEWYMTAEEAVEHGFADGILGTKGFETIKKIRGLKTLKRRS